MDVLDETWYIQYANVILLDDLLLERVDVAYSAISQFVESKLVKVHSAGPMLLLHAGANREWGAVFVTRLC